MLCRGNCCVYVFAWPRASSGDDSCAFTNISLAFAACCAPGVIQTDNYYSAWRCRTIPSPWETETPKAGGNNGYGSDGMPQLTIKTNPEAQSTAAHSTGSSKPACELILL